MEEIFKQYGTPIIIVTIIVALIAIFGILLANGGPIMTQFSNLIETFFEEAKFTGGGSASTIIGGFIL